MSDGEVRIGFVGCGGIGNHHLKLWQNINNAKVVAVCDIIPERAEKAGETMGAQAFTDMREMLSTAEIDAVDICTPSGMHAEQGIMALEAGKHVLVEKPIDIDLAKIDRLIDIADSTGLKLACIFQYRFSPQIQTANRLIHEGKLGRILSCSTYVKWWRAQDYYDADAWRGTYALDGGVLGNQGIHSLDQLCWMAGPVAEVEYAKLDTVERNIEAETLAFAVVRFENGARGVIEASTNCFPGMATRTQIFGTRGSAEFDGNKVLSFRVLDEEVDLEPEGGQETDGRADPMAIGLAGHEAQMADYVISILEDRPVLCDGRSARVGVDCLNKIYRKAGVKQKIGT